MDITDRLIKKYLTDKKAATEPRRSRDCPSEAALNAYMEGSISKAENEKITQHISQCLFCLELIEQASRQDMSIREPGPSKETIRRAIEIAKGQNLIKPHYRLKKHLWLIGTIISFGLSFVFSRYFLQFLILALILGIKWAVLDITANGKTSIMIYDFWHRHHSHRPREDQKKHTKRFSD